MSLNSIVKSLRPNDWLKNIFVFAGLIFSPQLATLPLFISLVKMTIAFILASSAVYLINDIFDREADRIHPFKKERPLAKGTLSIQSAVTTSLIFALSALLLAYSDSLMGAFFILLYFLLNAAYTLFLKKMVIIDVFCIAAGFMLRILAGTIGVGIPPSSWLILCGLFITLFLGFAKRRAELSQLEESVIEVRQVLSHYSTAFLDQLIAISGAGVIITYTLYIMSPETMQIYQTRYLLLTAPFVIYAVFRYLYLLHRKGAGERPTSDLLHDIHIRLSFFGWILLMIYFVIRSWDKT